MTKSPTIWNPIDRAAAEARVRELRPRINDCPDARGEWRLLSMLLHEDAESFDDIKRWRSQLH